MKKRLFFVIAAISLLSSPCFADSVFMLQFGSFETEAEAQSHLGDLKSKHANLIGTLPTSIRTISLPPDNLTVYRTQAGPLGTREQAQSVCSQFAAAGDECYVVETAMVAQGAPVGTGPANAPSGTMTTASATPAPAAPAPIMPPQQQNGTTINGAMQPMPSAPSAAPVTMASPQPMESELASASANQQSQEQAIAANPPQPHQASVTHSIWWHLDPFAKDKSAPSSAPAPTAPASSMAAPVEVVSAQPSPPLTAMPESAPVVMAANAPAAPAMTATEIPPSMMSLPPPPPPLRGETPVASAPAMAPQPTGMIPPVASASPSPVVVMAPFKASPSVPPGGGEAMAAGSGNVRVGEAQRVPLSQENTPSEMPAMVASVPAPTAIPLVQPPVNLHPSATIGQKTLWAQIGRFSDAQAALAFWEGYRQSHPDFPVVRVRVTASYQAQKRGDMQVSLRVGPFARPEFVSNLCATIPTDKLRCGLNADLGMAANAFGPNPGYLSESRYHH